MFFSHKTARADALELTPHMCFDRYRGHEPLPSYVLITHIALPLNRFSIPQARITYPRSCPHNQPLLPHGITLNERQIFGGAGSMADESPIPQRIPVRLGVEPLGTMSKLFRRASVLTFEVLVARLTTNGVAKLKSRKEKIRVTASSAIAWVKRILSSPTLNAAVQNGTTVVSSNRFNRRPHGNRVVQTGFNVPLNDGINSWCHRSFFLEGGKSDCNSAIEIYEIYERFPVPYDFDQSDSDPDSLTTKKFR
ncbi:hypothetical protein DFH09DRAFT_1282371 [Mycena vulgaris]|nr:hypothetical protein DFH09DRAFT_1282371 [Mycena vulgaris]